MRITCIQALPPTVERAGVADPNSGERGGPVPPRRRSDRLSDKQTQALTHPLRVRILEMHIRMRSRSLSMETLMRALGQTPEYKHVKAAEVRYHRDRLLNAKLLPV
jgi:hypothetical protein